MMTSFGDEHARIAARKNYIAGAFAAIDANQLDLDVVVKKFDRHWRFCHCTKCGFRIDDQKDIGNVDVERDGDEPLACHKKCPAFELHAQSFDEIEELMRTTKSETVARAGRDAIQRAFTEREELRGKTEMLEAANQELREEVEKNKNGIGFFNLNDNATRAAIMAQLAITAPKVENLPQPELSVIFAEGRMQKQSITLLGREMSIDEAEAFVFRLYEITARARLHEGANGG